LSNCFLEEKDLIVIGGGVAGYVAAIKAGQEGLKVRPETQLFLGSLMLILDRLLA
jgi:pyruvate/2-oxoglutarate dehydrogenase complex dihydrolipoamide dehydrogenase (E3) component